MRRNRIPFLVVVTVLAAALAMLPALAGDDPADMATRIAEWEKAFNAGDVNAIASMYAEDGTRMPYQAPTISGREAIAANVQATLDQGIAKIELKLGGAEGHGNLAWAHGTYHLMTADGATAQKGKWMNVSKKVGGQWVIQADIWNTDAPE